MLWPEQLGVLIAALRYCVITMEGVFQGTLVFGEVYVSRNTSLSICMCPILKDGEF